MDIASGQQHSLALDDAGCVLHNSSESNSNALRSLVYVWGYNGYCRLGLGNQVDALKPKVVPQFAGPSEATMAQGIAAGPSSSVVIDKQGMYWMAGKVRMSNLLF